MHAGEEEVLAGDPSYSNRVQSIRSSDHQHTSHHVFTFRASLCARAQAPRATAFGGRRGCAGVLPLQEVRAPARPGHPKLLDGNTARP